MNISVNRNSVYIHYDNQSSLHLRTNMCTIKGPKILMLNFILLEIFRNGATDMVKIHTRKNLTNMITKHVPIAKFKRCLDLQIIHVDY